MATKKEKVGIGSEAEGKTCFVATPVSTDSSAIRRTTDGLVSAAIRPVLEKLGFTVVVPHEMTSPGSITVQIIDKLLHSQLVIANLTGLNRTSCTSSRFGMPRDCP